MATPCPGFSGQRFDPHSGVGRTSSRGCWRGVVRPRRAHFHEQFLVIKQNGLVAKYRRHFELLSALLNWLSVEVMESTFVKGLKPEVKAELRLMRPNGLAQIMELA